MRALNSRPPSEGWIGAPVPLALDLGLADQVGIHASHATVYAEGFVLHFEVTVKRPPTLICGDAMALARRSGQDPDGLDLHFGVEFADGRRADWQTTWIRVNRNSAGSPSLPARDMDPAVSIRVQAIDGRGSDFHYRTRHWVWPVPPPGLLTLRAGWPAADLPIRAVDIDASPLIEARSRSYPLWGLEGNEH